jgi:putative ABC transport system permease protein
MFRNYLKTTLRNLWRNKSFSVINIMGLTLGLTCSLLIMLWVEDEYGVDAFHENGARVYSVYERQNHDGQWYAFHGTPAVMADEMKRVLPEVQYATNYSWNELATFEANNKIIRRAGNYAGADFFKMFSYHLLEGSATNALQTPSDIAISKRMAEDFFGSPAEAIGRTIRYQDKADFKITAVFDNVPQNSTKQFDYILNWHKFLEIFVGSDTIVASNNRAREWTNSGPSCYIMLRQGTDAKAFEKKIGRFLDNYNKDQTPRDYIRLGIQRYGDLYLHSGFDEKGNISGGRIQYVKLFGIVAIFILLIACINFMNLTTARSIKRAKEISVRKVVGAMRSSLMRQFIGEALLVAFLSVTVAVGIIILALPQFNQVTGKDITMPFNSPSFWLSIAVLLLITGFLSGSYPALYLSSFNPLRVLKGTLKIGKNALWFRKGLVVFQFMLSIVLIIGTIVVSQQVNYIQSVNLGYNRENLISIPLEGDLPGKFGVFKTQASHVPGIKEITTMSNNLTQIVNKTGAIEWEGKDPNSGIEFAWSMVGYDFAKTLNAQISQGIDFSTNFATDSVGYILNETALRITGYKDPIGKPFTFRQKRGTIIGVVKDFHFNSLHETINPLVLYLNGNMKWGRALIRTEPGKTKEALASLEKICKELNPKIPFTYNFSDEEYAKLYQSEQVVGQLANYFAFLAIFISCLGLLGLVMFTVEQRTKEFGIRKVLGASPVTLFNLLSKEFLLLVLIALVIASPLAWLAMDSWLQNYAYRVAISWWMFVIAGIVAIAIALVTVSLQAIGAAVTNPIKSLRTE